MVAVSGDPGPLIGDTDRRVRVAETLLLRAPDVEHVFTTVRADGIVEGASLTVTLKSRGDTDEVICRLRPQLELRMPGMKVTVDKQSVVRILGGGQATAALRSRPIEFSVQGPDPGEVDRVSAELMMRLAQVPGVIYLAGAGQWRAGGQLSRWGERTSTSSVDLTRADRDAPASSTDADSHPTGYPVACWAILMMTRSMIFGMILIAAGLGAAADLRQPTVISVVGGVITSTLLTPVVVLTGNS